MIEGCQETLEQINRDLVFAQRGVDICRTEQLFRIYIAVKSLWHAATPLGQRALLCDLKEMIEGYPAARELIDSRLLKRIEGM